MADPAPPASAHRSRLRFVIWLVPLLAVIALVLWDAVRQARHLQQASALYGVAVHAPPIDAASPTGFANNRRHIIYPSRWVDGQHWIVQAQQMLATGDARLRHVDHDNAPTGRDVHWSAPFRWWLGLCAWIDHTLTGKPLGSAAERAAIFANPLLLIALLLILVPLVARQVGDISAALLALGIASSPPLRILFAPDNPDHHGLIQLCAMLTLFALIAGGGGWTGRTSSSPTLVNDCGWLPHTTRARRAFLFSGIVGGVGLWISAVSMIPVFVGLAAGALLSAYLKRRVADEFAHFEPNLWRLWGVSGAATALLAYAIEYFPAHLGWRLEVNHPLYAFAWLGAGELLAQLTARLSRSPLAIHYSGLRLIAASAAVGAPIVAIAIGGNRVFAVSNPFLWALSHDYTPEFQGLLATLQRIGWSPATIASFLPMLLIPLGATLLILRKAPSPAAALIAIPLVASTLFFAMSFRELRWWTVEYGFLLAVAALVPTLFPNSPAFRRQRLGANALVFALFAPGVVLTVHSTAQRPPLSRDDILSLVERDLAHSLRQRAGDEPLVVLSSPATTSRLIYFGDAQGLGTAYWENLDGLQRAAAIFAAPTVDEAHALIREAGITHLVFVSWDNFVEPYIRLARGLSPDAPLHKPAFALELLRNETLPPWLQKLPEHLPQLPALANEHVAIFEVTDRTQPQHVLVRTARHFLYRGQLSTARELVPQLEQHNANLASQIALGRVLFAAKAQTALPAVVARIAGLLDQRNTLEPEDRVDLIALLTLTGREDLARPLLIETLEALDDRALRRLTPGALTSVLGLSRRFDIRWPDTRLNSLANELLPPDGRL